MSKRVVVLIFQILCVLFLFSAAGAFKAEIVPSEIRPGDAFVIKVTGLETSDMPSVVLNDRTFYFSSCGSGCFNAIGAVGMGTKPEKYTVRLDTGKKIKDLDLIVKPVVFPEISLTLSPDKVFLSPEDQERANREAEKLRSIWQKISDKLWEDDFIPPLANQFSTVFGVKRIINKEKISHHQGLDIKGREGDRIKASNRGRVVLAEELFFGGNTIVLDHGQGIYTVYMHLSKFRVRTGDIVSKNSVIGLVGSTGRASGPHLHFGVKVQDISANPASFFQLGF